MRRPTLPTLTQVTIVLSALIAFAYLARPVVVPILVAWVGSMALKPLVTWLRRRRLPAPLAAAIIVTVFFSAISTGVYYLGAPATAWMKSAPETLPRLKEKYQKVFRPLSRLDQAAAGLTATTANTNSAPATTSANASVPAHSLLGKVFSWSSTAAVGIGEVIALLFLLLASGDFFSHKFAGFMKTHEEKKRALDMFHEIQHAVSRYLFTVGLINIGLGILIGTALYFLKMPNAVLWGAAAALLNFIPYFGPIIGVIAVTLTGLISFDSPLQGLAPAAVYFSCHLVEANLLTPYALGYRFTMNPFIIFIFLMFCIWLWGLVGAFLAVPILVTLKVICERVKTLSFLGELLSD